MGNRRIILELDREPQDLQAVWRLDSIARLIQQALINSIEKDVDFNSSTDRHLFNDIYEKILADLHPAKSQGKRISNALDN